MATNGDHQDLRKDEVGWYFVEQYYNTLSKSVDKLHLFYGTKSQFVSGLEAEVANVAVGRQDIQSRIAQMGFQDAKVRVSNVDSQASLDNIVIQVIGEISNKSEEPRKFVQTFVLAKQHAGYFVLNDILRYIKEEDEVTAAETDAAAEAAPAEDAAAAAPAAAAEPAPSTDAAATKPLDASVVDKKLEEVSAAAPEAATPAVPAVATPAVAVAKPAEPAAASAAPAAAVPAATPAAPAQVPNPEKASKEVAEEEVTKPEVPKEPAPTATAPTPAAAPAEPEKPKGPPKPMTWASRAAAAAGPARPAVAVPKTVPAGTAATAAAARPAAPASASSPVSSQAATVAKPAAAAAESPAAASAVAAAAPAKESDSEWQTAGVDSKRQNRPVSISGHVQDKETTLGYVKYVTEKVEAEALRSHLEKFGPLVYFDISRPKNCAFVEFGTAAGYHAAVAANPHIINGESILVEARRPKASAYGGANYSRGGAAGRGGRGGYEARNGTPGGGRGGYANGRGRGGAARGRGGAQTATAA